MNAKLLRLFFAIPIPQDLRDLMGQIQHDLLNIGNLITWVKPDQIHITLRFLGNQPEEQLTTIINCSKDILSRISPFVLGDSVLKVFPDVKYPRVLLVDFKKGIDEFLALQRKIDEALLANGLVFKNPKVTSHLTVGRIKGKTLDKDRQAIVEAVVKTPWEFKKPIEVKEIHLVQSQLTPQGPIYTTLSHWRLN